MTRLQRVQLMTQEIAEAILSAFDMDVTIVDEGLICIAGTGCHQQIIGQPLPQNTVFSQALRQGSEYIAKNIGSSHAFCTESAQLCCPIRLEQETIGVIGLRVFSQQQRQEIADKGQKLLQFMRRMAELVAVKVLEVEEMQRTMQRKKRLETVLGFIPEGIISIDRQARINSLNAAAEKMLKLTGGEAIGSHIGAVFPGTPLEEALISGREFVNREIKLWQQGCQHDYFISAKPVINDGMIQGVVASFRPAGGGERHLQGITPVSFPELTGISPCFCKVISEAKQAAAGLSPILIGGESGTGKALLAKAIHFNSNCRQGPFIAADCAALTGLLLEGELFGYAEGDFPGVEHSRKPGKFQQAQGGSIFLDEIGDMSPVLQAKLLRVIQENMVEPVGSTRGIPSNVRILTASGQDLAERVKAGLFREDLYEQLSAIQLMLPALRCRQEDIPLLARTFLHRLAAAYGKQITDFEPEALCCLQNYGWPENVRELENAVECAVIQARGTKVGIHDLPERLFYTEYDLSERQRLALLLSRFGYDVEGKKQVAAALNISLATLYRKIKKYYEVKAGFYCIQGKIGCN